MSVDLSKRPVPRRQRFTILLVGEGHAEVALLTHLKGLYASRGSGVAISIRNARGKGAAYVVNYAIRQTRNAAYRIHRGSRLSVVHEETETELLADR